MAAKVVIAGKYTSRSLGRLHCLLIYGTWKDEASLKAHMASPNSQRLVSEIEKVATLTLEQFNF